MHFLGLKESSILLIFIEVPFTNESSFSCIGNYFKIRKVWRLLAVVFRAGISVYWILDLVYGRLFKKKNGVKKKSYIFNILGQYAFSPIYDGYPSPCNLWNSNLSIDSYKKIYWIKYEIQMNWNCLTFLHFSSHKNTPIDFGKGKVLLCWLDP